MAKLTAPLLSFGARGKLADTLVYFPWKGIAAVRSFVIPANPRSAAQQTQRGYFTTAVAAWHNADLTADDKSAWNRLAGTLGRAMSGFNAFVRAYIDVVVAGNAWVTFTGATLTDNGSGDFEAQADEDGDTGADLQFVWGYSPSSLINTEDVTASGQQGNTGGVTAAPFATVYGKWLYPLDTGKQGESGTYSIHLGA